MSHKYGWWLFIGCSLIAIYSRTWNWVRSPIRNPLFLQFPRLPIFKEIQQIFTKLVKFSVLQTIFAKNLTIRLKICLFPWMERSIADARGRWATVRSWPSSSASISTPTETSNTIICAMSRGTWKSISPMLSPTTALWNWSKDHGVGSPDQFLHWIFG